MHDSRNFVQKYIPGMRQNDSHPGADWPATRDQWAFAGNKRCLTNHDALHVSDAVVLTGFQ
jgi:hypothetical protein